MIERFSPRVPEAELADLRDRRLTDIGSVRASINGLAIHVLRARSAQPEGHPVILTLRGGHRPAWEEPARFTAEMSAFFGALR